MSGFTKVILWTFGVVAVLGVVGAAVIAMNFSEVKHGVQNALGQSDEEESDVPEEDPELAALADSDSDEGFKVSDDESDDGLPSERQFADDLHHMTHQKVTASQKWGHLEITDERIEEMYETAEASDYTYRDFYMRALEAWMEGDFSNAVQVHNTIWNEQNGNVGKARGLMTEEEEREYKERHFE
ncbi:DUF6241 domain-containing protein [Lacicoccus alkaliphilus]|uniref:Uncharacterized protein n=1 Tax=Lacicoccus alkaliphilus DSM 16010 TaxID=1123231 RepID=A0A1M7CY81_9BACL|nr:DUF6241 domain-containing protein [Salinicoccus alkaliphilus]SHL72214.1 hypothetical protein SAMN02745189_00928 [Salinicoccus alkaliphilus DSM 16010]